MTAPFTITIRVFRSDDGWSYEISLWSGTFAVSPTKILTSKRAYRSPTTAWNAARAAADRMVR